MSLTRQVGEMDDAASGARALAEALLRLERDAHLSAELVRSLAEAACRLYDLPDGQGNAAALGVFQALAQLSDPPGLQALWSAWMKCRHPQLLGILRQNPDPPAQPLELLIWSSLALGQLEKLAEAPAGAIETLLVAAGDPDPALAQNALQALGALKTPQAQEEICRRVIETNHPIARQTALQAGYAPREPRWRALFYLLTEQWERYESLDFDSSLLRAVYQAGDDALRTRVAAHARQAGWAGYIEAVAGQRSMRSLDELSNQEWEVILALLGRHARWEEMWRLAQSAPAVWGARLLQSLSNAGWQPSQSGDLSAYYGLQQMALKCLQAGDPLQRLPRQPLALEGHTRRVTSLAFSPDSQTLASGSADRSVRLWQPATLEPGPRLEEPSGHSSFVVTIAFSPKGDCLASGSADRTVRLWQPADGRLMHTLGGHAGEVSALAFHPGGESLASGSQAATHLWNVAGGRLLGVLPGQEWGVVSLAFSPDGSLLGSSHADSALNLWRFPEGQAPRTLMERVARWQFNPAGRAGGWSLATCSSYGQARLWKAETGEQAASLEGRTDGEALAISPDGRCLAASDRRAIRLWELPGGTPLGALEGHSLPLVKICFSPDGQMIASSGRDKTLRLWQVNGGRPVACLEFETEAVEILEFSPNGSWLAYATQEHIALLPMDDLGSLLGAMHRRPQSAENPAALHPTGRIQELLDRPDLPAAERLWLAFGLELARWRGRYDIEVGAAHIQVGDFDIELEG